MSGTVGRGLVLVSAYMLITKPGVQNPHCDPCASARLFCRRNCYYEISEVGQGMETHTWQAYVRPNSCTWMGCRPRLWSPRPSTVVTWHPTTEYTGQRQALTALTPPASDCTVTVHAPQPPSPQPSLVPVSPCPACADTQNYSASAKRSVHLLACYCHNANFALKQGKIAAIRFCRHLCMKADN